MNRLQSLHFLQFTTHLCANLNSKRVNKIGQTLKNHSSTQVLSNVFLARNQDVTNLIGCLSLRNLIIRITFLFIKTKKKEKQCKYYLTFCGHNYIYIAQQKFRTLMSRPAKHDRRCSKGRSLYLLNYLEPDFSKFKSTLFLPIHVILFHFLHKLRTHLGIEYFTSS